MRDFAPPSDTGAPMLTSTPRTSRLILMAVAVYFASCAVSAILAPWMWLWAAGLPLALTNELQLTFGVIGVFAGGLAVGAFIATQEPHKHTGVISSLFAANVLDCLVTAYNVALGNLPVARGMLFVATALVWAVLLWRTLQQVNAR